MENNFDASILEEYSKIKEVIESFRKISGDKKPELVVDLEKMKRNIRRSFFARESGNDYFYRAM